MISAIDKIKNLGLLFCDYAGATDLPPFKQFNLIYGWNGSGKTTLSCLFDAIGGTSIPNLEYQIRDENDAKYKQGDPFPCKIRVFNTDYIQNNVTLLESRTKSISILLGKENKDLVASVEADRRLLLGGPGAPGKKVLRETYQASMDNLVSSRSIRFTEVAKTIGAAIGGNALRGYRKPEAEKDFQTLKAKASLTESALTEALACVKQESMPEVSGVLLEKLVLQPGDVPLEMKDVLDRATNEAARLLTATPESEIISRLAANPDIATWVEEGRALHSKHNSKACEYCLQPLPEFRVRELAHHFSDADRKIKDGLDTLTDSLTTAFAKVKSSSPVDGMHLFSELRVEWAAAIHLFETSKRTLTESIDRLLNELKMKKRDTAHAFALKEHPDVQPLLDSIANLNRITARHNGKSKEFDKARNEAVRLLKGHYLSGLFDEIKQTDTTVATFAGQIKSLDEEIKIIEDRIGENVAKMSSDHKACETLNEKLATFLGHRELCFVPQPANAEKGKGSTTTAGYRIMRGDRPAVRLSEGEKTAIAFVYFVVHLSDRNFAVDEGIVVVDDPISSLDSNSLYQAFSVLKNAVKDGKQVFILTHSFDFLKLLVNWRRYGGGAGHFMIKNTLVNGTRCAQIRPMDKELHDYESEYHYLFKVLKQLSKDQDGSIAAAYPIPNVARKVWDTFLMFSVPNGKNQYRKVEELKQMGFDAEKLDAIYKFTNDQSHITGAGFNPALVQEAKKVLEELFEMMAQIAPDHYKFLDAATQI